MEKKFLFGVNKGLETLLIGHLAYLIFLQKLSIAFWDRLIVLHRFVRRVAGGKLALHAKRGACGKMQ